jgi:hypothetical protein
METQFVENDSIEQSFPLIIDNDDDSVNLKQNEIQFPHDDIIHCLPPMENSFPKCIQNLEPLVSKFNKSLSGQCTV